jgi:hypothetical protein
MPIEAVLGNDGNETMALASYRGLRLRNGHGDGPIQVLPLQIPPHTKVSTSLTLDTPELEGEDRGTIELITADGKIMNLGDFRYRTWRRLPPVGF